jgi:hypothetical protein
MLYVSMLSAAELQSVRKGRGMTDDEDTPVRIEKTSNARLDGQKEGA